MIKKQADLQGLRVLNTRPVAQAEALNQAIIAAGGQAISCPTLAINPLPVSLWLPGLPALEPIDFAIFTSSNAVHAFFLGLSQANLNWPTSIKVIAIGKATALALKAQQVAIHDMPAISDSENLLTLPCLQDLKNKTILLIKGEGGRPLIADTLCTRAAKLSQINVYQRSLPDFNKESLIALWQNDAIDIIVLTSQQSIHQLFVLFGKAAGSWLQEKPCLVISARLAKVASELGIKNIISGSPDSIIDTLLQYQGRLYHGQESEHPRATNNRLRNKTY